MAMHLTLASRQKSSHRIDQVSALAENTRESRLDSRLEVRVLARLGQGCGWGQTRRRARQPRRRGGRSHLQRSTCGCACRLPTPPAARSYHLQREVITSRHAPYRPHMATENTKCYLVTYYNNVIWSDQQINHMLIHIIINKYSHK